MIGAQKKETGIITPDIKLIFTTDGRFDVTAEPAHVIIARSFVLVGNRGVKSIGVDFFSKRFVRIPGEPPQVIRRAALLAFTVKNKPNHQSSRTWKPEPEAQQ